MAYIDAWASRNGWLGNCAFATWLGMAKESIKSVERDGVRSESGVREFPRGKTH